MDNPFSWEYLTTRPGENEVFGPFAVLFLIAYAIGFLVSIVVYNGGARKVFPNPVLHRMARRWSAWALVVFGLGLFFFVVRALQISLLTLEMRIWMWLSILSVGALVVYIAYDYQRHYAGRVKEYEELKRKQAYLQAATAGGAGYLSAQSRTVKRKRR